MSKKINGKYAALIVTVIGKVCAICFPMDDITNFLYLIGSVFAPMIAIPLCPDLPACRSAYERITGADG